MMVMWVDSNANQQTIRKSTNRHVIMLSHVVVTLAWWEWGCWLLRKSTNRHGNVVDSNKNQQMVKWSWRWDDGNVGGLSHQHDGNVVDSNANQRIVTWSWHWHDGNVGCEWTLTQINQPYANQWLCDANQRIVTWCNVVNSYANQRIFMWSWHWHDGNVGVGGL